MSVFTNSASRSAEQARAYTAAVLELLGSRDPLEVLRATAEAMERALDGLSTREIGKPEGKGKWSMRQVLRHMADSELVWGYRLRMVLAHDRPSLTGYDQDLWAERLGYERADEGRSLRDFSVLRDSNLRLLADISEDDLERVGLHAERGPESVRHMIALYAGHDLVHLRQLDRIRRAATGDDSTDAAPTK